LTSYEEAKASSYSTHKEKKMRQLGKAFSIIARARAREEMMHMDVDAFHAPSECHGLVSRGEDRRLRQARRHAKSVSGLNRRQFRQALKKLNQRHFEKLVEAFIPVGFL
jgi:hypothetical protein